MKKLIILAAAMLMLASCGDTSKMDSIIAKDASSADDTSSQADVSLNDIDSAVIAEAEKTASQYIIDSTPNILEAYGLDSMDLSDGDIDIDLTMLTPNLVYAQVFDMVNEPDKYVGKKVRAKGNFAYTTDPKTGGEYFAVYIADAAACCQQGMEFVLAGEHKYPEDYPALDSTITVEGVFGTYMENGWRYCQLKDAALEAV